MVTLIGFVIGAKHSNVADGESVNCDQEGCASNDIHIEICASPLEAGEDKAEKMNEEGVVAEISPRHRPAAWELFDSPDYHGYSRDTCLCRMRHKHVYAEFLIMWSKRFSPNKHRSFVMICSV